MENDDLLCGSCAFLKPDTLLDGEIVALDEKGRSSFNLLQHHRSQASAIHYYPFDVLIYRGRSLLSVPLEQRRELLVQAVENMRSGGGLVHLSEAFNGDPGGLIAAAKDSGFEGIVAKRKDSLYQSGKRTGAWVKYKVNQGQEFVIGGYTPGKPFDSLIVGYYDGDGLLYAAKVRTDLCRNFVVTWQPNLRVYRSMLAPLSTCRRRSAPSEP